MLRARLARACLAPLAASTASAAAGQRSWRVRGSAQHRARPLASFWAGAGPEYSEEYAEKKYPGWRREYPYDKETGKQPPYPEDSEGLQHHPEYSEKWEDSPTKKSAAIGRLRQPWSSAAAGAAAALAATAVAAAVQ